MNRLTEQYHVQFRLFLAVFRFVFAHFGPVVGVLSRFVSIGFEAYWLVFYLVERGFVFRTIRIKEGRRLVCVWGQIWQTKQESSFGRERGGRKYS